MGPRPLLLWKMKELLRIMGQDEEEVMCSSPQREGTLKPVM